ncbi:MAG: hypothetical protein LBQ54_04705 [Planctomycetaceae bacterium]|jgi:hypothetical protein|nr:hypothetical protein [Planctomycetaceae bacterium]
MKSIFHLITKRFYPSRLECFCGLAVLLCWGSPVFSAEGEFLSEIQLKCNTLSKNVRPVPSSRVTAAGQQTIAAVETLIGRIRYYDSRENSVAGSISVRELRGLRETLESGKPDPKILATAQEKFHKSRQWHQEKVFSDAMQGLDHYLTVKQSFEDKEYVSQRINFFQKLPGLVEKYQQKQDAATSILLAEAVKFMEESREGTEVLDLLKANLTGPNVKFRVNINVLSPLFERTINENIDVQENILGTQIRGNGTFFGKTSMALIPNNHTAKIQLAVDSAMVTHTLGVNGPARILSDNVITAATVKNLLVSPENGIIAESASTEGTIESNVQNISFTRQGPLLRQIGTNQVYSRKAASEAESLRLAKLKINRNVDDKVETEIAKVNGKIRQWNTLPEEAPIRANFSVTRAKTTDRELFFNMLTSTDGFLTTTVQSPVFSRRSDLYVQIHQSAIHNTMSPLANQTLDEKELWEELRQLFPAMFEASQKSAAKTPQESFLTLGFAAVPVDVSFEEDMIKIKVNTLFLRENKRDYPGMEITLVYKITGQNNRFRLEPVEVQALPLGFNPKVNRMSVREQTIRTIVLKRIRKLTEKPIVLGTLRGNDLPLPALRPSYVSAKDGWLSLGYVVDSK